VNRCKERGSSTIRRGIETMRNRRLIVLLCLVIYFGSYAAISRMGMRRGDTLGVGGYYLVVPDSEFAAVLNCLSVVVYYPAIVFEDLCGTAEPPLCIFPLFRLD